MEFAAAGVWLPLSSFMPGVGPAGPGLPELTRIPQKGLGGVSRL